jgi:hypothetical protein
MIALEIYGKPNVLRRLFSSKNGWIRVYMPFGNIDLHEEEE